MGKSGKGSKKSGSKKVKKLHLKEEKKRIGSRREVFQGKAEQTSGGLTKGDIIHRKNKGYLSRKASRRGYEKWNKMRHSKKGSKFLENQFSRN